MSNSVHIADVTPRDGLQNIPTIIPTELKIALVAKILAAGVDEIQIGSFVSPKMVPQFADMGALAMRLIAQFGADRFCALVVNERGMEDALKSGLKKMVFVFSASEEHNLQNVRQSRAASIKALAHLSQRVKEEPVSIRADIATVFGCPFAGRLPLREILWSLEGVAHLGIAEVTLCDTLGVATPALIEEVLLASIKEFPQLQLRLHLHNAKGLALANALKGYEIGLRAFDAALGGLGGCPFAPGAPGNIATEEVAVMFAAKGITMGIDKEKLFLALSFLGQILADNMLKRPLRNSFIKHQRKKRFLG